MDKEKEEQLLADVKYLGGILERRGKLDLNDGFELLIKHIALLQARVGDLETSNANLSKCVKQLQDHVLALEGRKKDTPD